MAGPRRFLSGSAPRRRLGRPRGSTAGWDRGSRMIHAVVSAIDDLGGAVRVAVDRSSGSTPVAVGETTTTPPPRRSIRLGFGGVVRRGPGAAFCTAGSVGPARWLPARRMSARRRGGGRIPQLCRQIADRMRGLDAQLRGSKGYRSGVRAADRHGAARVRGVDPRRDHHQTGTVGHRREKES